MHAHASIDDCRFAQRFESGEVDPADFNHRGHLRLAYVYLCNEPSATVARDRMRSAIKGFLVRHSVDPAKYHETLTAAWMDAVRYFIARADSPRSFRELIGVDDRLLDKDIMLTHYTRERLFTKRARRSYVAPDVSLIPGA